MMMVVAAMSVDIDYYDDNNYDLGTPLVPLQLLPQVIFLLITLHRSNDSKPNDSNNSKGKEYF